MVFLICVLALIKGNGACMKTVPGDVPHIDEPAMNWHLLCNNCAAATDLPCSEEHMCDSSYLKRSKNGAQCSTYSCSKGQMMAYVNLISSEIDRAVCDKNSQLVWKTETGEVYGKTLQATALAYTADSHGCISAKCAKGQMFSKGQPVKQATCIAGAYRISGKAASQIACGTPCDACTALLNDGLTCPDGHTCTTVSEREGQCSEAYCPSGIMTADGVEVDSLTCNGQSQNSVGFEKYQLQKRLHRLIFLACDKCTALTNTGMSCPAGFVCTAAASQSGQCPIMICSVGEMKANPGNVVVTSLSCDGTAQWIDSQTAVYTAAQCEF
ncbi:unnamed protein product [Heligmosomoides polygyrus]|uniref:C6 domain-containing protein n=1 Tax=Heligmosomoides polygyrus TaxID=6339 RepID=A0A3P7Z8S2_HELPZ|nr:unnamed protein product [Heligmosomoides polygyrus]